MAKNLGKFFLWEIKVPVLRQLGSFVSWGSYLAFKVSTTQAKHGVRSSLPPSCKATDDKRLRGTSLER